MKAKQTICFNIKASWHLISKMYNSAGVKHGLTTSIGYVLLNIDAENGTPATKIGPIIGIESTSLTRMLKSLEEKRLIFKKSDDKDKRMVRIFLTEEGKRKRELSKKSVKIFNNKIFNTIPKEKLDIFMEVIDKINKITEEGIENSKILITNEYANNNK
jgi:MarR family transcriptional regulator, organic hydroperoxide resistance regulator